jgi:hypothetical protein
MSPPNRLGHLLNGPPGQQPPPGPPGPGGGSQQPTVRATPPTSPFGPGNVPVTAAQGGVEFDPEVIQSFGGKLISTVGQELTAARKHLNDKPRDVESGAFTTFCLWLAHSYVQATEYADVDLITKEKVLTEVDGKLKETARILREAEKKSTLK